MIKILSKLTTLSIVSVVILAACDSIPSIGDKGVNCNDPQAINLVTDTLHKSLNSEAKEYTKGFETVSTGSNIRASINQLVTSLTQIRTTKEDPQSTKNFCAGSLKVTIPTDMMEKANFTRDYYSQLNIEEYAYQQDLALEANSIIYDIEYSVQPTDDGEMIFLELQNGSDLSAFLATVIVDANQKNNVQRIKARENKAASQAALNRERENAIAIEEAEIEASNEFVEIAAEQARVKAAMDYKRGELNRLWKQGSKEAQDAITESQKNWVKERDNICINEARGAEPAYQEIVRMQCITRLLGERYYELKQFFDNY